MGVTDFDTKLAVVVRDDLSVLIHQHPPLRPDGTLATTVTFPSPGRYRIVVDAYPRPGADIPRNFQLTRDVTVRGTWKPKPVGTPPCLPA